MTQQFTASEVRDRKRFEEWYATHSFNYSRDPIGSRDCSLQWEAWKAARADLLEAQEKAAPVGMLHIGADASNQYGKTATFHYADACMDLSLGDHEVFPHPAPSDAERLAEALRACALNWQEIAAATWRGYSVSASNVDKASANAYMHCAQDIRKALAAHSAQAQPPAASVPDAETLRLHLGELTPDEVCVAKAAYRLALAAQENPNG